MRRLLREGVHHVVTLVSEKLAVVRGEVLLKGDLLRPFRPSFFDGAGGRGVRISPSTFADWLGVFSLMPDPLLSCSQLDPSRHKNSEKTPIDSRSSDGHSSADNTAATNISACVHAVPTSKPQHHPPLPFPLPLPPLPSFLHAHLPPGDGFVCPVSCAVHGEPTGLRSRRRESEQAPREGERSGTDVRGECPRRFNPFVGSRQPGAEAKLSTRSKSTHFIAATVAFDSLHGAGFEMTNGANDPTRVDFITTTRFFQETM